MHGRSSTLSASCVQERVLCGEGSSAHPAAVHVSAQSVVQLLRLLGSETRQHANTLGTKAGVWPRGKCRNLAPLAWVAAGANMPAAPVLSRLLAPCSWG
jgi:hypothetical protein